MSLLLKIFPLILPLAVKWAERSEERILLEGVSLRACYELWRAFVGFKTGCRQGAVSAASPLWAVSEPQRRRQPVFNPTRRAGRLLAILYVTRSTSVVYTQRFARALRIAKFLSCKCPPKFITGSREPFLSDAILMGVEYPERIRLLKVARVPLPGDPALRIAARLSGFLSPQTAGMALRYGIFVREDWWENRGLIAHECVHTGQYERLGGFNGFLSGYLRECLEVGYPAAPMEQEAILRSATIRG